MRIFEISYVPRVGVVFTPGEIALLMETSRLHYDRKCRSVGQVGGFLYGMSNYASETPKAQHDLTWREVDTLAKITEGGNLPGKPVELLALHTSILALFDALRTHRVEPKELVKGANKPTEGSNHVG